MHDTLSIADLSVFCEYLAPLELCIGGKTQQTKARLLKALVKYIFEPVQITERCVFQYLLSSHVFPRVWKVARTAQIET